MLFSEPKIPQWERRGQRRTVSAGFQCSSASRKFLNSGSAVVDGMPVVRFSALQRAENSSMPPAAMMARNGAAFQCSSASRKFLNRWPGTVMPAAGGRFSALQRAENSSISSELSNAITSSCFSALQRAENSSIQSLNSTTYSRVAFQCSSASRKFLNGRRRPA